MNEIKIEDTKYKPKKTANSREFQISAFTQVLFATVQYRIKRCCIKYTIEKEKTHANYFMEKS